MRKTVKQKWIKTGLVILVFLLIFFITFTINRLYIQKNTDLVNVVVAYKKIPAFSLITADRVTLAKRPRVVVPKEAILDMSVFLSGKKYYAGDLGFGPGDVIRLDRLSEGKSGVAGDIAALEDEGKMLVSVNTNLVKSCSNLVTPGTVVDAIVFIKGQMVGEPDRIISPAEDPRLSNLLVVDKKNAESSPPAEKGREAIPAVITLIMDKTSMDVAKALVQYNEKGSVYLLPVGFKGDVYLAAQK